jgi:hypothetical protein
MIPPRNIALKVGDQFLRRGERVVAFRAAEMPMIAFACLIVEPQNALAVDDVREPILERVLRSGKGSRHSPENQLGKGALRINNSPPEKLHSLHVGDYANTWPLLSMTTTRAEAAMGPGEYVYCELPEPLVAEWASTIRVEEAPTTAAEPKS